MFASAAQSESVPTLSGIALAMPSRISPCFRFDIPQEDKDGIPRFQLLQQWHKRPTAPVVFFLFDLLWTDGHDLTGKSVVRRRERLEQITTSVPGIQVGGYIENHGKALFQLAKEKGLEGIIAKRKSSVYPTGKTLTGLVEDQVTTTARIRGVRLH